MTAAEKAQFKVQLDKKIAEVQKDITDLVELTKPIPPENAIGRVSRMDAINNKSVNEAALRRARQKMIKLNLAIDNMDKSDFGKCANCKRPIQIGRLMFLPEINRCIRCAR